MVTIRSAMPAENTVWTVALGQLLLIFRSQENWLIRPIGQSVGALSFQLKDRIQAIKRNVKRSSADRLIGSSRSLSKECRPIPISSRFEIRRERVSSPSKLLTIYPFFCFSRLVPLPPSLFVSLFYRVLIHIQIYSNA